MTNLLKNTIYKLYVLSLIGLVIWVAQFIYPLIFWEFEHTGIAKQEVLSGNETALEKMHKLRKFIDNKQNIRRINLADHEFNEQYVEGHFHHVGVSMAEPVLNGCDYCHSTMPHQKDKEIRTFLNMHSYFAACETCHYDAGENQKNIAYRWITTETGEAIRMPLDLLKDESVPGDLTNGIIRGNYGARIIPWDKVSNEHLSVIRLSNIDEAKKYLGEYKYMDAKEQKYILKDMHRQITTKPIECDGCHSEDDTLITYEDLGYPIARSKELMDTAIVGMIKKYKKFHFPNLFIRKDDRKRDYQND